MKLQGLEIARLDNVTKYYRLGEVQITALNGITLVLQEGDFTVIAGPSGSGKSTMLHLLGCIDKPDKGSIIIDGADTTGQSLEELTEVRLKRIGFIFQTFNLVPVLTAFENVELPLLFRQMGHGEIKDRVDEALHKVGLSDRMRHYPSRLSGGQQQRVAIARALVGHPGLILADEPTANLDSKTGSEIIELLLRVNQDERVTILIATHDPAVKGKANNIINIQDGRINELMSL